MNVQQNRVHTLNAKQPFYVVCPRHRPGSISLKFSKLGRIAQMCVVFYTTACLCRFWVYARTFSLVFLCVLSLPERVSSEHTHHVFFMVLGKP